MKISVFTLMGSRTDLSPQNRCKIMELEIDSGSKCAFPMPEKDNVIEMTISDITKHFLVVKIDNRENPIAVFVEELAKEKSE